MKPMLSVIVPVYNVEKYLDKCISSIINQTFKNIEILLIDDGSTDLSGEICDAWKQKDSRIKVFHKQNGGLSDARNYGLMNASGIYVGFVDSDDFLDEEMYNRLMLGCEKYNADVGCCNKVRVFNDKKICENVISSNKFINKSQALLLLLLSDPSVCNKIFKKDLFQNIKFPYGKLYEDIATTPHLIDKSNGMYIDCIAGYYYNQLNNGSIIHKSFNIKKMDYFYNTKELNDFINDKYPELLMASERNLALVLTTLITDIYIYKKSYYNEYELLLSELSNIDYKRNKYISTFKKIMIFCDLHHLGWVVNFAKKIRRKF